MNFTKFVIFCISISIACSVSAQSTPQMLDNLKTVIPPSPTAASLGKYAAWPVSLYTGVPNINIPLYELKGRSVSVPVSLNYHSSGIRVGEVAPWVGLGWSLDAGGVITRSLRGLPDDDPYSGYLLLRQEYNKPGDLASGTPNYKTDSANTVAAANGLADEEPDVYSFNAMGKSYKLFFSGNGTIVTSPYSEIKFTCNWADSTWKAVLEDGTILNFGGGMSKGHYVEITNNSKISGNPAYDIDQFISSWYLRSIVTTAGETINFTYTAGTITQNTFFSQSDNMYNTNNGPGATTMSTCLTGCGGQTVFVPGVKTSWQQQTVTVLNLSTIESDLGRVEFVSHPTERLDLQGGYALDSIKVFSKYQNSYLKKFAFIYTYSQAAGGNVAAVTSQSYFNYRLKLNAVQEIPSDGSQSKYWDFAYNPQSLPSHISFAQDYWGYFNGATTNNTLLPEIFPPQAVSGSFSQPTYNTGNRNPDSASMQAEMLTQITYPTGGTTTLQYAPNNYFVTKEVDVNRNITASIRVDSAHLNPFITQVKDTFKIRGQQSINIAATSYFSANYLSDLGSPNTLGGVNVAYLYPSAHTLHPLSANNITYTYTGSGQPTQYQQISVPLIDTGYYVLTATINADRNDFNPPEANYYAKLDVTLGYLDSSTTAPIEQLAGGVRVSSQVIYDGVDTAKNQYISYTYSNPNVIAPLDVQDEYITAYTEQIKSAWDGTDCQYLGSLCTQNYLTRHSASKESLGSISGGTIGYGTVRTTYGRNGENGYSISQFSTGGDENSATASVFPYAPACSTDWRRGLLLQQADYTSAGVILKKQVENYLFMYPLYIHGFKSGIVNGYHDGVDHGLSNVMRVDENVKTEQVQHTSSVQTVYNAATGDSLYTTAYYYYDDSANTQPVRTITTNSKGDTVLTYARTALEQAAINTSIPLSAAATVAMDTLNARNMVGMPVESEKYVKGVLTYKALTNYALYPGSLVLPNNVMLQNASNAIETRVQFNRYDAKGNLAEQQKTSDAKHSYIWDYSGTYAVAEAVNADSANIAYTSFEADGTGNWVVGSTVRDTTKGITGTKSYAVSNGAVSKSGLGTGRNYIVSYWTTNTSAYSSITGNKSGYPIQGKTITVNGTAWRYFEHKVTGVSSVSISGTGNIDELRLYPDTALMTTFTYMPLVGTSSQCDPNNRITYYQYDGLQRLYYVMDQDRNVVKKYNYSYTTSTVPVITYYSAAKSGTYTRNNCGTGYTGSTVTYNVVAGMYTSQVSQAAADSLAQNDVNTNGQAYANTNGTCTANVTNYTITSPNSSGLSGFTAKFTNTATSVVTTFNIPTAGGTLGTLPGGTYTVVLAKTGNTTTQYIYTVCTNTHAAAVTATFSSVVIGSSCNTVNADTVE